MYIYIRGPIMRAISHQLQHLTLELEEQPLEECEDSPLEGIFDGGEWTGMAQ